MNISSWHAAVAALTTLSMTASGQRIILIPAGNMISSGPPPGMMTSPRGLLDSGLDEPPCRQRRLEPWRREIREKCRADADMHCTPRKEEEEEEPLRVLLTNFKESRSNPTEELLVMTPDNNDMESTLLDLTKEMDSFFDSIFSPPSQAEEESENSGSGGDPFDNIFNQMMGFSLRAFDEMAAMNTLNTDMSPRIPLPPMEIEMIEDEGEENVSFSEYSSEGSIDEESQDVFGWEEREAEDAIPSPPDASESSYDFIEANSHRVPLPLDYTEVEGESGDVEMEMVPPEEAAESVLDFMVASLAQRMSAAAAVAATAQQEEQEGVEEVGDLPLSVQDLPAHLFKLGSNLLTEVHTHRRLTENGEEDARLHAKERLARRLTEYQSDVFFQPEDNGGTTITIYTSTSSSYTGGGGLPPPSFMMPLLFGGGGMMMMDAPPRSQLGMGSRDLDECMESRYDNGDLDNECHTAVNTFYLAVEDREMVPPMTAEMKRSLETFQEEWIKMASYATPQTTEEEVKCGPSLMFWGMLMITIAMMIDHYYSSDEENEEEEANEFDYGQLPEDDAGNARAFVGVPVQVV